MNNFKKYLQTILANASTNHAIALGIRLDLFNALAEFSKDRPATAENLASKLDLKQGYVFELLSALACGDIIEVSENGQKFWILEERKEIMAEDSIPLYGINIVMPMLESTVDEVLGCIKKGGPERVKFQPLVNNSKNGNIMMTSKHASFKKHADFDLLPSIGVKELLENGISVLDIGCGMGVQLLHLAQKYPKSSFVGFDIFENSIKTANQQKEEKGVKNIEFLTLNAHELKSEWNEKFDLALCFDSFKHIPDPIKALKEVYRVLKPNGIVAISEINGNNENAHYEKTHNQDLATFWYTYGLFLRKPEEDPQKETISMFAYWGSEQAKKMFKEAGFQGIQIKETKLSDLNSLFMAKKISSIR